VVQANRTSKPHQKFPGSRVIYTHQNARSGARQNSAGGEWHLRRFSGRSQRARGQQGGRLDSSAWAGRHLPPLEKGVHMLGQCVGPHSERRRRRFRCHIGSFGRGGRRLRYSAAAALQCSAPVKTSPPLIQKDFSHPFWASTGFWAHTFPPVDVRQKTTEGRTTI